MNLVEHADAKSRMGTGNLKSTDRRHAEIIFCVLGRKWSPTSRAILDLLRIVRLAALVAPEGIRAGSSTKSSTRMM